MIKLVVEYPEGTRAEYKDNFTYIYNAKNEIIEAHKHDSHKAYAIVEATTQESQDTLFLEVQ